MIKIKDLKKYYSKEKKTVRSIDGVSLEIYPGETLGLVGESGCGKSTVAKCLLGLTPPSAGSIEYKSKSLTELKGSSLKSFRHETAMIFQDPYASLNPRMTAADIISEPIEIHKLLRGAEKKRRLDQLLDLVGLPKTSKTRFPHEFSGGQKQRIGIARALATNPRLIVCDEPISALDVSVQAQIINLLKQLQKEMGLTYLFIAHDLRIVKYLSDRVAVMYLGQIMEVAPAKQLYESPMHPYTQALLSSIPIPDPIIEKKRSRIILRGEVPSPLDPPKGCPFATRCPHATPTCHHVRPALKEISPGHKAACHLLGEIKQPLFSLSK
ncbi:MAG: ATP-binding cassette domain-containing protein [Simkaniaceae bacterium]|nr:ATP-binding cassette domain-containing protein [Candidatus Sacchlamyda saccharinae]